MSGAEQVAVLVRVHRGQRTKWAYHEPCDDGHSGSEGHMRVRKGGDGWEYCCRTCGHTVPYDELDTGLSTRW